MPSLPPPCSTPAPPTPLGLSGRVGPLRKGEGTRRRFEALLQSERIMLYGRVTENLARNGFRLRERPETESEPAVRARLAASPG
jgi:hypothetical protein